MKQIKQLKDVVTDQDEEFRYQYSDFALNYDYKKFLEEAFRIDITAAYTSRKPPIKEKGKVLELGCVGIIIFLKSGRILQMTNSEWGSLEIVK